MGFFIKQKELDLAMKLKLHEIDFICDKTKSLAESGKVAEAKKIADKLDNAYPNNFTVSICLGYVCAIETNYHQSIEYFLKAIHLEPHNFVAYNMISLPLIQSGKFLEALDYCNKGLDLKPDNVDLLGNKGNVLFRLFRYSEAIKCYKKIIELAPNFARAYVSIGNAYQLERKTTLAEQAFNRALEIDPENYDAKLNLSTLYVASDRYELAEKIYNNLIDAYPGESTTYFYKAILELNRGNYEEGFKLYEYRRRETLKVVGNFTPPLWLGLEDISNKTILVIGEQGFGDHFQFARYLILLEGLGAKIVIELRSELISIFNEMKCKFTIIKKGDSLPQFDFQCYFASLPFIFKTNTKNIPNLIPYLFCNKDKSTLWAEKIGVNTKKRIGLAWSGSKAYGNFDARSIPLKELVKILNENFEFHSLQIFYNDKDEKLLQDFESIKRHEKGIVDFLDTASLINHMDLIITIDTSIAHLAGALGKKTFLLLEKNPDWRWLNYGNKSLWYPSLKLFKQVEYGDWESVINEVFNELTKLTSSNS